MKIDIPFHGSRNRVLAKIYHVQPKPAPSREITGKELLRFFAACVLGAVGVWVLLVAWPILERVSR